MKQVALWMGACLMAGLTGCTAQQWYASGQSWQRNQCFKQMDTAQRNHCVASTWMPYDEYKRELHADAERARSARP